jgi:dephospho-CoA kinase
LSDISDANSETTESSRQTIIGLTGLACAGKSSVAAHLAGKGALVIEVDKLGHAALNDDAVKEKLCAHFGPEILDKKGNILRKILGEKVFASENELEFLESTVHPQMFRIVEQTIRDNPLKTIVIDAALLHYMGLDKMCAVVLLVEADFTQRLARAKQRGWSEAELNLRDTALGNRLSEHDPQRVRIINNNTEISATMEEVDLIWKEIGNGK